jgi:metal-sulfur cluster biosynthetic enzyme
MTPIRRRNVTRKDVRLALATVQDPELQRSIVDLDMVRDIVFDSNASEPRSSSSRQAALFAMTFVRAEQALAEIAGGRQVEVRLDAMSCEEGDTLGGASTTAASS